MNSAAGITGAGRGRGNLENHWKHEASLKEANDAISIDQVHELYRDSSSKPLHPELKEKLAGWLK